MSLAWRHPHLYQLQRHSAKLHESWRELFRTRRGRVWLSEWLHKRHKSARSLLRLCHTSNVRTRWCHHRRRHPPCPPFLITDTKTVDSKDCNIRHDSLSSNIYGRLRQHAGRSVRPRSIRRRCPAKRKPEFGLPNLRLHCRTRHLSRSSTDPDEDLPSKTRQSHHQMDRIMSDRADNDLYRPHAVPPTLCSTPRSTELSMADFHANLAPTQLSIFDRPRPHLRSLCHLLWHNTSTRRLYDSGWIHTGIVVSRLYHYTHRLFLLGYLGRVCSGLGSIHSIHRFHRKCRHCVGMDRKSGRVGSKEGRKERCPGAADIRGRVRRFRAF